MLYGVTRQPTQHIKIYNYFLTRKGYIELYSFSLTKNIEILEKMWYNINKLEVRILKDFRLTKRIYDDEFLPRYNELRKKQKGDNWLKDNLIIRSSSAEFLIFEKQTHNKGIQVRFEKGDLWLIQKAMSEL